MGYFDDDIDSIQLSIQTIEDERKQLNEIPSYFRAKWYHDVMINHLAEKRQIPREAFEASDIFFVHPDDIVAELPDWMKDRSHGFVYDNRYLTFGGRYVFPVKDVRGDVMGFLSYVYNEDPKYIDSKTFGYRAKLTTMFGMEKLPEYYSSKRSLFVTEGVMDMVYLRYHGHNAVSLLTSKIGNYQAVILKRFGNRCIILADNDSFDKFTEDRTAGEGFVKQASYCLPEARIYQTIRASDINDVTRLDNGIYEKQVIKDLEAMESLLCMPVEFRQRGKVHGKRYY